MEKGYFRRSADFYTHAIATSGSTNLTTLASRCKAKFSRGINVVLVDAKTDLGKSFTPSFFIDPGRTFCSMETFKEGILRLQEDFVKTISNLVDTYDPDNELLFLVILTNTANAEAHGYKIPVKKLTTENKH